MNKNKFIFEDILTISRIKYGKIENYKTYNWKLKQIYSINNYGVFLREEKYMRKLVVILFSALFLLSLTACSGGENNNNEANSTANNNQNTEVEQSTDNNNNNNVATNDENDESDNNSENVSDDNNNNNDDNDVPDKLADFEETKELQANIDDLNSLTPEIEVDNDNKRIILFADDNDHKQYKSIFIKQKQRLKIIELNKDDGLLFNDTI